MLIIAAVCVGFFAAAGIRARSDRIYPNVSVGGITLGGMTEDEAVRALEASQFGAYNGRSVTVEFTDGESPVGSLTVTASAAGLECDCSALAHAAYLHGRHDGFAASAADYIRCMFTQTDVGNIDEPTPDEAAIRALITSFAASVDTAPTQDVVFMGEGELRFTRGVPGRRINVKAAASAVCGAFEQMRFETLRCPVDTLPPSDTDPEALYEMIHTEPRDACFDEQFSVVPEVFGAEPGADLAAVIGGASYGETVTVPIITLSPSVFSAELEALLYRDILSASTTPLTSNETRSKNVALAAASINGVVLLPGEVFSYNDTVGERTVEKGYGAATAYSGGRVVQEVGGGICQVSSTLYYCCLLADLNIVFRTGHAYYQTYVPYGMDATVSWGAPDYKFSNSTDYPIKIVAHRNGGSVTVELWGTKTDDSYVEMEYTVDEHTACSVSYVEDATVAPGAQVVSDYGRDGMIVSTYRCRYSGDGTLLERVPEAVSRYSTRDKVVLVAPGEAPASH